MFLTAPAAAYISNTLLDMLYLAYRLKCTTATGTLVTAVDAKASWSFTVVPITTNQPARKSRVCHQHRRNACDSGLHSQSLDKWGRLNHWLHHEFLAFPGNAKFYSVASLVAQWIEGLPTTAIWLSYPSHPSHTYSV